MQKNSVAYSIASNVTEPGLHNFVLKLPDKPEYPELTRHLYSTMRSDNPLSASALTGFPPVIAADTHTLILGSFPGKASLDAGQYYAYRHNQFWQLLSAVLHIDLLPMDYAARLRHLLANRIGLWDVFHSCVREGSLDTAIREGKWNDFDHLREHYPQLQRVCFNGKTAAKIESYFRQKGFDTLVLPSSSPANARMSLSEKQHHWSRITLPPAT